MTSMKISLSGRIGFAIRVKKAGGVHIIAKMPYARNTWALVRDAGFKVGNGTLTGITAYQKLFILESLQLDNKELERAQKGYDPDSSAEFYDDNTDWYDDPEHHSMFEDDPQSDEDYKAELDSLIDKDLKNGIDAKIKKIREDAGADDYDVENHLDDIMSSRMRMVDELVNNKNKLVEYRKAIHEKGSEDGSTKSTNKDTSKDKEQQKSLADKALANTLKALNGGL